MSVLLGCVADDLTGATDLALTLVANGMRTLQLIGVPGPDTTVPEADAIVVALKSRTSPVAEAVEESLAALAFLQTAGARQFFFKYCSTFDSTPRGNIGPVADALLDKLGSSFTLACPAFPSNGRTLYQGHLFVKGVLLSESPMRDHPVTPMTDANLVRVLQAQSRRPVGLVPYEIVAEGADAIAARFDDLQRKGIGHAIVDAITDDDLRSIGKAAEALRLVTGGSAVAAGLPANFREAGLLPPIGSQPTFEAPTGLAAVLSGSCSTATREQVEQAQAAMPSLRLDPLALASGEQSVEKTLAWARPRLNDGPILIYSSAAPADVTAVQDKLGREASGKQIEDTLARIAQGLVTSGVRRLVVAGGETSGAVVKKLKLSALSIGPEIAPGVPWTRSHGDPDIALALKSGNFGGPRFFLEALEMLETG